METFNRFILRKGKLEQIKVPKEDAMKEIDEVMSEDSEFLKIMEKM